VERQRLFQLRHQGYDRRRKAKKRAIWKRMARQMKAALLAQAAQATPEPVVLAAPITLPGIPMRLALPAPVEDPLMLQINALAAARAAARAPALLPIQRSHSAD
jgi:hypothetical protein